jgi:hypothetical protein
MNNIRLFMVSVQVSLHSRNVRRGADLLFNEVDTDEVPEMIGAMARSPDTGHLVVDIQLYICEISD